MKHRLRPVHILTRRRRRARPGRLRRGSVLIIVLVIILLLTYGVYGFTERMLAEARAADAHGRAVQATALADSGIEYAASLIAARAADPEVPVSLYHEPSQFGGMIVQPSTVPSAVGRFSLVAPVAGDTSFRQLRFGLSDESGKLNLNAIGGMGLDDLQQQTMLMSLPGMTEEIADAILDFLDEDDEPRLLGAEEEYYATLVPPALAKNGPLDSVEELLLVRGVTAELLYGEDANRNGLLDPSENDGAASPPLDDGDGVLRPGWLSYITIYSSESNSASATGEPKIDINQALLTELFDGIVEAMDDEEAAQFIVAYRVAGPTDPENSTPAANASGAGNTGSDSGGTDSGTGGTENSSGGTGSSSPTGGGTGGSPGNTSSTSKTNSGTTGGSSGNGMTAGQAQTIDNTAGKLGNALGGNAAGSVTRAGIDLSGGSKFEIGSLFDLVERQVNVEIDGTMTTLSSPFTVANILESLPTLNNQFALSENTAVAGRINVNEAPYEVLLGIPDMTPQIAEAIVAGRMDGSGQALPETADRRTTAWLVEQDIVDLPTLRKLDRYLTARGDVFRVQSVGFFDGGGPFARIEAVIDGSVTPAKIVSYRDITDLGRGFAPSQLLPSGGQ